MFSLHIDTTQLREAMTDIERRQFPFAMSRSMNDALPILQETQRAGILRRFTINTGAQPFLLNMVKYTPADQSTKYNLSVALRVEGPRSATGKGEARAGIMTRHEDGGVRRADALDYPFIIPTDDLRGGSYDVVPRGMYPSNLRLAPRRAIEGGTMEPNYRTTRKGTIQLQGKRRTFVLDDRGDNPKTWGIFQRIGRGRRSSIRMIWAFRKQIALRPRLEFFDTVSTHGPGIIADRFMVRLDEALATAR